LFFGQIFTIDILSKPLYNYSKPLNNMTTITSTQLRSNLAEIVDKVDSGEDVIMVFGKGKGAKKIRLSSTQPPKKGAFEDFLNSPAYKSFKPSKELQNHPNLKQYYKDNYYKD
jgi:hypothetical protein